MRTLKEILSLSNKKGKSKSAFKSSYKKWQKMQDEAYEEMEDIIFKEETSPNSNPHYSSRIDQLLIRIGQSREMQDIIVEHYCMIYELGEAEAIKELTSK